MASAVPFIAEDFHLSPITMGAVLSAFFAGYALMQIPGGLLADRFGPRAVLTTSIACWSVLTALTGAVPGLTSMLAVRVLFGIGESPFPSAAPKTLSIWFPPREVGRASGLLLASTGIGAAVAPLFVATLIGVWGWRSLFYALFAPGAALAIVVWRYVGNSPTDSTHLARREKTEYDAIAVEQIPAKTSLSESLRTPGLLWCGLCLFFVNMVNWGLLNWLPTYLLQSRGFGVEKMGIFATLVNLAGALGYPLGGYVGDRYFGQNLRVPIILGLIVSGGFTYLAARAPTGEWAVAYLLVVFLFLNAGATAICTLPLVIAPKHAVGRAVGIVNTAGQLAGLLSPLLIGYILDTTHGNFEIVLDCLVGVTLIAIYPASQIRQTVRGRLGGVLSS